MPLDKVPAVALPALASDMLREKYEREPDDGHPYRFAEGRKVSVNPSNSGTWEDLGADLRLWRLRIHSPGALNLNLGFTRYRMPEGGSLFIYAPEGEGFLGPYSDADNEEHGQLWTPILDGEEVVLELIVPTDRRYELQLDLSSVNHGFKGFGSSR